MGNSFPGLQQKDDDPLLNPCASVFIRGYSFSSDHRGASVLWTPK